jgi:hypothetical protein
MRKKILWSWKKIKQQKNHILNNTLSEMDRYDDNSPGWKFAEWECVESPLRLTSRSPKDSAKNTIESDLVRHT